MSKAPRPYQVVVDKPGKPKGEGLLFHGEEIAKLAARNLADETGYTARVIENRLSGPHMTSARTIATYEPGKREE